MVVKHLCWKLTHSLKIVLGVFSRVILRNLTYVWRQKLWPLSASRFHVPQSFEAITKITVYFGQGKMDLTVDRGIVFLSNNSKSRNLYEKN